MNSNITNKKKKEEKKKKEKEEKEEKEKEEKEEKRKRRKRRKENNNLFILNNILIYGPKGTGKYTLALDIIKNIVNQI